MFTIIFHLINIKKQVIRVKMFKKSHEHMTLL